MDQKQIISRLKQSFNESGIPGLRLEQMRTPAHQALEIGLSFGEKGLRLICEVKSDSRSTTIERAISQLQELMKQKYRKTPSRALLFPSCLNRCDQTAGQEHPVH
jgi:hypothetical protein